MILRLKRLGILFWLTWSFSFSTYFYFLRYAVREAIRMKSFLTGEGLRENCAKKHFRIRISGQAAPRRTLDFSRIKKWTTKAGIRATVVLWFPFCKTISSQSLFRNETISKKAKENSFNLRSTHRSTLKTISSWSRNWTAGSLITRRRETPFKVMMVLKTDGIFQS